MPFRSSAVSVAAVCTLALTLLAARVGAWGPVSHAAFNCLGSAPVVEGSVGACISNPWVLAGSDAPDAFGFGGFAVSGSKNECADLLYVHDPLFGAALMEYANASSVPIRAPLTSAEFALFARSFSGHVPADAVGFHPDGGVLCKMDLAGPCSAAGILYLPLWTLMTMLDALVAADPAGLSPAALAELHDPYAALDAEGRLQPLTEALAASSQLYSKSQPKFKPFTASAARACFTFWGKNQRFVFARAAAANAPSSTNDRDAVLAWATNTTTPTLHAEAQHQFTCATEASAAFRAAVQAGRGGDAGLAAVGDIVKRCFAR